MNKINGPKPLNIQPLVHAQTAEPTNKLSNLSISQKQESFESHKEFPQQNILNSSSPTNTKESMSLLQMMLAEANQIVQIDVLSNCLNDGFITQADIQLVSEFWGQNIDEAKGNLRMTLENWGLEEVQKLLADYRLGA